MKKISVIVPVYNKEDYLTRCLDSICFQSMPADDVEIICVDDKSSDSSLEILKDYQEKYPNILVMEREVNSGTPGKPRNEALEVATGEYVFFVDADDFLGVEALERMYAFAQEHNSDTLLCKFKGVGGRGVPKSMFKKNEVQVDLANSRIIYTLTALKLFRLSLLNDNNIRFPVNIKSGEDQPFVMEAYLKSKVISVLGDYDYYYAVKPKGAHMSAAYVPPKIFYSGMAQIFRSIHESKLSDERKEKVMAIFLNRHFDFSRTKNFTINYQKEKEEWMFYLRELVVKNVPLHVDDLVLPHVRIKLKLIRENDLENLSLFTLEEKNQSFDTKIVNGELIRDSEYLQIYHLPVDDLKVAYKDRLNHFISVLTMEDDSVVLEGDTNHTLLNFDNNRKQHLTGVLVHRTTKKERKIESEYDESNRFRFKIDFSIFTKSIKDLGAWDLFIESEIEGYKKRGRLGNSRNPSFNFHDLSYKTKLLDYKVKPYFTKPHDNLSFDVKKLTQTTPKNPNQEGNLFKKIKSILND